MEDTLTPAERNLPRMGQHQRLRDMRIFFQYATLREFCEPVERITGRKVRSFHSSIDTKVAGLALETFIFYPEGRTGRRGSIWRLTTRSEAASREGDSGSPAAPGP